MLPLHGVTVIDLSRALAGPYCTTLLADMGADVIKIESPGGGDPSRNWPPFDGEHSLYFDSANRNKKSVALNLYSNEGRELLTRMLAGADVLVENFKLGTLNAMGFGPDTLRSINPGMIHMAINAYGNKGPLKDRPGLDQVIQGISGLISVTGSPDGQTYRVGVPIIDITAGMTAAFAVAAMLFGRGKGNPAREVSTSLFETALALSTFQGQSAITHGTVPRPCGNNHPSITPYGAYPTATEPIVIAVSTEGHWKAFCTIIDRPELLEDPRFVTGRERTAHRVELESLLQDALRRVSAEQWIDRLNEVGIPCGPIYNYAQAVESEQTRSLGLVQLTHRSDGSELKLLRGPLSVDAEPLNIRLAPPHLGEHTMEVLDGMGLGTEEIDHLVAIGAVGTGRTLAATERNRT